MENDSVLLLHSQYVFADQGHTPFYLDRVNYGISLKSSPEFTFADAIPYNTPEREKIQIMLDEYSKKMNPYWMSAVVNRSIMESGNSIGCIQREQPMHSDDSGWRVLTGVENKTELKDRNTFMPCRIKEILYTEPSLLRYIDKPIGTIVIRDRHGIFYDRFDAAYNPRVAQ